MTTIIDENILFDELKEIIKEINKHSSRPLTDYISKHTSKNKKSLFFVSSINLGIIFLGILPENFKIFGISFSEMQNNPTYLFIILLIINLYFFIMFFSHSKNDFTNYKYIKNKILWISDFNYQKTYERIHAITMGNTNNLIKDFVQGMKISKYSEDDIARLKNKLIKYTKGIINNNNNNSKKIQDISYLDFFKNELDSAKHSSSIFNHGSLIQNFLNYEDYFKKKRKLDSAYINAMRSYNKSILKIDIVYFEYFLPIIFALISLCFIIRKIYVSI